MRTRIISDELVILELTIEEHVKMSKALCDVMSNIEPCQIKSILSSSPDSAYEFQYSVYVREAEGRRAGIGWLPFDGCSDSFAIAYAAHPTVDIEFTTDGSIWYVTKRQLRFIESCLAVRSWQRDHVYELDVA